MRERFVESGNALSDSLPLAGQLRLKIGHLPDGVFVEPLLEPILKARQVVGLDYEAFEKLRNPDEFMKVRNGGYFIEWECGADLSADTNRILHNRPINLHPGCHCFLFRVDVF